MNIDQEVANLQHLPIGELREVYERVFGEPTTNRHAQCLIRRIAWRLQANHQGGLSERARQRATALADEADLRLYPPANRPPAPERTVTRPAPATIAGADDELAVGTVLQRLYKGQSIVVEVVDNGVRYEGRLYTSLSAVANAVTGSHWNGRHFFRLDRRAKG